MLANRVRIGSKKVDEGILGEWIFNEAIMNTVTFTIGQNSNFKFYVKQYADSSEEVKNFIEVIDAGGGHRAITYKEGAATGIDFVYFGGLKGWADGYRHIKFTDLSNLTPTELDILTDFITNNATKGW